MGHVSVKGLGKAYKRYKSRWGRIAEWFHLVRAETLYSRYWVLRGINFEIRPGEAVGIIGINGAGKSTLLKLITGTTQPTEGRVVISGSVAPLLELGMGFHPDFTGRQNVFMAGQLLGFRTDEIAAMMPQIEAFAEIGTYIDEPVRVFSSGMQVRLAFSVATARRPDVLVIDEALSVGDAYFQHKSFERIRAFGKAGTTLLIVSHDKQAIQSLCDRTILLAHGRVEKDGQPEEVLDYYNAMLAEHQNQAVAVVKRDDGRTQTISGTGEATLAGIRILDLDGKQIEAADVGQPVTLQIEVETHAEIDQLVLGYGIKDRLGQVIFGTNTQHTGQSLRNVRANARIRFEISFSMNVGPGTYSVVTALHSSYNHLAHNYEWTDQALIFQVVNISRLHFDGLAWLQPVIRLGEVDAPDKPL